MARPHDQTQDGTTGYLTIAEAAILLKFSQATLYRHVGQGEIPGACKIGGSWRISAAVLAESFKTPTLSPEAAEAILHAMPLAVKR